MKVKKEDLPESIQEKLDDDVELELELSPEAMELAQEDIRIRSEARQGRADRLLEDTKEELEAITSLIDKTEKGEINQAQLRRQLKKQKRYFRSSIFKIKQMDKRTGRS